MAETREPTAGVRVAEPTGVDAVAVVVTAAAPVMPEEARDSPLTKPVRVAVRVGLAEP